MKSKNWMITRKYSLLHYNYNLQVFSFISQIHCHFFLSTDIPPRITTKYYTTLHIFVWDDKNGFLIIFLCRRRFMSHFLKITE